MYVTAYQSSPNFGVRFNRGNIKSMVNADAQRLQQNLCKLENPEVRFDNFFQNTEEVLKKYHLQVANGFKQEAENKKISAAMEQFKKILPEMAKYGDSETNIEISKYSEWKRQIVQAANHWDKGFEFTVSNPKFNNWEYSIRFRHDFVTNGEILPEKNENLSITPFIDFYNNKTYANNIFSIDLESQAKDFIQILELKYLSEIMSRSRIKDANEMLKAYNIINDSHWNDIAHKLNCIHKGQTHIVKEDAVYNKALDNYINELGIF